MSFLKKLFGTPENLSPEEEAQAAARRNFETLRDDGVRAMQMGEVPFALKCFEEALNIMPGDRRTQAFKAEAHLRMGQYAEALPLLKSLAADEPCNHDLQLMLLQTLGELQEFGELKERAAALLAARADDPRVLYFAAEAEHGLGEDIWAVAHLTQALNLRPDYAAARLLRADVLQSMGQTAEALDDMRALLADDAENETYLLRTARLLAAKGQEEELQEAARLLQQLRSLNPFDRDAVLLLGSIYEATAQRDKALALYDEAIDLMPDFAEAYRSRGGVRHALHDEAGAADDLKKSLELAPEAAAVPDGEYTNVENRMNDRYKAMNPYGF